MPTSNRLLLAVAIAAVAFVLRWHAAGVLAIDIDEDDRLRAAQQQAAALRAGDLAALTELNYRHEHPPLAKLAFAGALLTVPPAPLVPDRPVDARPARTLPRAQLMACRRLAVLLSALTIGLLAFADPVAGGLLAVHAWSIKYGSEAMLEPLALLLATVVVLAWGRSRVGETGEPDRWLALSAVALGATAAAKYPFALAGVAVLLDAGRRLAGGAPRRLGRCVLGWGAASLVVFVLCHPYLWPDPVGRLTASLTFHGEFSQSGVVTSSGLPRWQALRWLFSTPVATNPEVGLFRVAVDPLIGIFAVFGVVGLARRRPAFAIWLGLGAVFLFSWPTRWPHYPVLVHVPWTLAAAEGLRWAIASFRAPPAEVSEPA